MIRNTLAAALFISAVLLSGSDGPQFPWPNLCGFALFVPFALLASKTEEV